MAKIALVTGSSRGIGAAIARRLAREFITVVNYRTGEAAAKAVVASIEAAGGNAIALPADLGSLADIEKLFAAISDRFGHLDVLVNNAAMGGGKSLEQIDAEHYERLFAVNVRGALFATKAAVTLFGANGGKIINITSGAAQAAPPGLSVYSATKAALEVMTRSHAAELGPRHITVNAVSPGITETDMLQETIPVHVQLAMAANTALRRLGTPEDIADVVGFLTTEDARWITGQIIGVNGGLR